MAATPVVLVAHESGVASWGTFAGDVPQTCRTSQPWKAARPHESPQMRLAQLPTTRQTRHTLLRHPHTHTSGSVAARQQEDTTQHTATSAGHGRHDWPQAKHTPAPNADSQSQPQTNGTSATQTTDKAGQGQNIAAATGKTANTKQPQASNTGRDTKPSHSSNHSRSQQANRKHKHDTTQHKRTKRKRTSQTSTRNKNNKTHTKQEKIRLTNPPTPLGGYPERQGQDRR